MIVATFFAAGLLAWLGCFPVIRFLRRRGVVDRPGERSSHFVPTPRGGGIALVAVLVLGCAAYAVLLRDTTLALLAGALFLLAIVSFIDDVRPLPQGTRFLVHLVTAAGFVLHIAIASSRTSSPASFQEWVAFVLLHGALVFYIVGYTNAFNFMDGINGLAAGQAAVSGFGVIAITGILGAETLALGCAAALLAGVACGFIPHNFPRARVFMGDVGSVPLGFLSASLAVVLAQRAGWGLIVPFVLLQANFILDTSITFLRRLMRGDKWYLPHREHFYQRLVRSGKTHTEVTGWEMLLQLGVLAGIIGYIHLPAARVFIACAIVLAWLLFFAWAELRFRANASQSVSTATGFHNAETRV